MEHRDHVRLIRDAFAGIVPGETWADVGAGRGAFTLAAAELLGSGARLFALDRDAASLEANERALDQAFPTTDLTPIVADLADLAVEVNAIGLPTLDGLLAANVLHFFEPGRREMIVGALVERLRPGGRFLVVEYETGRPTSWLPHPLPWTEWQRLARAAGLSAARRVGGHPGASAGGMYAALAVRPG